MTDARNSVASRRFTVRIGLAGINEIGGLVDVSDVTLRRVGIAHDYARLWKLSQRPPHQHTRYVARVFTAKPIQFENFVRPFFTAYAST